MDVLFDCGIFKISLHVTLALTVLRVIANQREKICLVGSGVCICVATHGLNENKKF